MKLLLTNTCGEGSGRADLNAGFTFNSIHFCLVWIIFNKQFGFLRTSIMTVFSVKWYNKHKNTAKQQTGFPDSVFLCCSV